MAERRHLEPHPHSLSSPPDANTPSEHDPRTLRMASKAAQKRLTKEYVAMQKEPPPFVWAAPDEKNILTWNYIIRGPPDSPFTGGEYHGVLLFPSEYPFKPPGIKMFTPSGRFHPDKKICFSMSDFHPGTWNPAWSVATILTGLLSFMLSDEMTTGSVTSTDSDKKILASRSHAWNLGQKRFKDAFPDFCVATPVDLPNMGEQRTSSTASTTTDSTTDVVDTAATTPAAPPSRVGAVTNVRQSASTTAHGRTDNIPAPKAVQGWAQLIWEKWRWAAFFVLALFVSRMSSA